ncbi:hypothetical protein EIP91_004124 [Steccherinum ochraceum]|uniref:DUF6533 domain-containing protein n=1 Tax=Steccherinum ochraceum TaxID=92696 RepID=A0A4R0RKT2_9APHY|nr:hypothetical protein EIP91_004124 [Steccherinum ochraceum]
MFAGLLAYDTFLTLSREVECIWKRKTGLVTALFVLQRWTLLLSGIVQNLPTNHPWECVCVFSFMFSSYDWFRRCKSFSILDYVLVILGNIGTAAFSALRVWAIWDCALGPTVAVALASAIVPAVNLFGVAEITSFSTVGGGCIPAVRFSPDIAIRVARVVGYTARSAAIASDALVLVLTWIRTADVWRESKKTKGFKVTVSSLLLRDGTLYFGMLLIMNIVALILHYA